MRKQIKYASIFLIAALAGFGAYKTYVPSDNYTSTQDLMMAENILALTEFQNPVENGTVDVRVYNRPCYFEVIDDTRQVPDPGHWMTENDHYTEYHHVLSVKYYQVCVLKDYKEAPKWDLCDRSKATGCSWCTSHGGATQKPDIPDEGIWKP